MVFSGFLGSVTHKMLIASGIILSLSSEQEEMELFNSVFYFKL